MADSPVIDARQLAALRKRTFTAAGKALRALDDALAVHREARETGYLPSAVSLRKPAEKYLQLLDTLACIDSVLTPEALEAAEPAEDEGTVPVSRDDLDVLVQFARGVVTEAGTGDGTPLGRLMAAAGNGH